jgi:hypothetical protein
MPPRLHRLITAAIIFGSLAFWVNHWAGRFFAARAVAEDRMFELQKLMSRGYFSPALQAQVDAALDQSHRALGLAIGGPLLLIFGFFGALWLLGRRGGTG